MRRNQKALSHETSDGDLVRLAAHGNEQAFTLLYRRHHGAVYRFALQMSGSTQVAEEVTQEVFMILAQGNAVYDRRKGALPSFLYGVARNFVLRALRRERPYAMSLDDSTGEPLDLPATEEDTLSGLTQAEQLETLRQAILSLPEPYREVVVLCDLHELDYAEAALIVGCPVGTVRSRLHRARVLLGWKLRRNQNCPV